jgi:hypothetical protein
MSYGSLDPARNEFSNALARLLPSNSPIITTPVASVLLIKPVAPSIIMEMPIVHPPLASDSKIVSSVPVLDFDVAVDSPLLSYNDNMPGIDHLPDNNNSMQLSLQADFYTVPIQLLSIKLSGQVKILMRPPPLAKKILFGSKDSPIDCLLKLSGTPAYHDSSDSAYPVMDCLYLSCAPKHGSINFRFLPYFRDYIPHLGGWDPQDTDASSDDDDHQHLCHNLETFWSPVRHRSRGNYPHRPLCSGGRGGTTYVKTPDPLRVSVL